MILVDRHIHSTFSDGANTPEEIVQEAINRQMTTIGFSDHSYLFFDERFCIKDYTGYIAEINRLKEKYRDKIEILLGVEQDYYSNEYPYKFDYKIGSVHFIKCGNDYLSVDHTPDIMMTGVKKHFDGDIYAFCERYYAMVSEIIERTDADIIGHFDLVSKFNENGELFDSNHPRYVAAYQAAVDKLIKYNKPFEINTGAISRGYRVTPYPSVPIKKYIEEKGGSFVLSSDSHQKETICFKFDEFSL